MRAACPALLCLSFDDPNDVCRRIQTLKLPSLNCNFFPLKCNYRHQQFVMFNCFLSSLTTKIKRYYLSKPGQFQLGDTAPYPTRPESPSSEEFTVIDCEWADFTLMRSLQLQWQHRPLSRTVVPPLARCLRTFSVSGADIYRIATEDL